MLILSSRSRKQIAVLVGVAIAFFILSSACKPTPSHPPSTSEGKSGGTLVYGLTLSPSGIDPHVNASSELGIPLTSVYDTLIFRSPKAGTDADTPFVPGLAESWSISNDGLSYTFNLRQDVSFHDGTPFNAQAVKVNLERVLDPKTASQKAVFLLGPLQSVEITGEFQIVLHLESPYAPLLDGLAQVYLGIASPAAISQWGANYQFHQVGTGPFRFVEYIPNDHLTIERFDDYQWSPELYNHHGPAYLDRVEFRFFSDPASRSLALEAGDVQVMGEVPPLDANRLDQTTQFQVLPVQLPGQSLGFLLNTQNPPLDDPIVRHALILASDRGAIVSTIFGQYSPVADGPLTRATYGYAPAASPIPFDPQQASAILNEAGWIDTDGDGTLDKDGQPLVLDSVVMTWGSLPEVIQLLQAQWKEVGIETNVSPLTYPAALEAAREGSYHLIPQAYAGTDPDLLYTYYHSQAPFNWSQIDDTELDDLLILGRNEIDVAARLRAYTDAQARIRDLHLLVPVRDPVNLNVISESVEGLRFDAHGWFPLLHDVYFD
jgi:peptide/nickel transport system substrate-binding protein